MGNPQLSDEAKVLSVEEVAEIQARDVTRLRGSTHRLDRIVLTVEERDALCATVRVLREQLASAEKLKQGYYDEAAKGWEKFRESERGLTALREQLAQASNVSAESAAKEIAERFIGSGENIELRRERCAEAVLTAIIRATKEQS